MVGASYITRRYLVVDDPFVDEDWVSIGGMWSALGAVAKNICMAHDPTLYSQLGFFCDPGDTTEMTMRNRYWRQFDADAAKARVLEIGIIPADVVSTSANVLDAIDRHEFVDAVDVETFEQQNVYGASEFAEPDVRDQLREAFKKIRALYRSAASQQHAILLVIA